jgi:hypothetical protein
MCLLVAAMLVRCAHDSAPAPTVSRMAPPNTTHWMTWCSRCSMATSRLASVIGPPNGGRSPLAVGATGRVAAVTNPLRGREVEDQQRAGVLVGC